MNCTDLNGTSGFGEKSPSDFVISGIYKFGSGKSYEVSASFVSLLESYYLLITPVGEGTSMMTIGLLTIYFSGLSLFSLISFFYTTNYFGVYLVYCLLL